MQSPVIDLPYQAWPATVNPVNEWGPTSWRSLPAEQQPDWPDEHALEQSLKVLSTLPPLVFAGEARALRSSLAEVAAGRAFLLQAGDCAESFNDFTTAICRMTLSLSRMLSAVKSLKDSAQSPA